MTETMILTAESRIRERYRVLHQIGGGAMARVYLTEDTPTGELYAVKVQQLCGPGVTSKEETMVEISSREADFLSTLSHHSLPRVTDYFREGDSFYLVMEYVDGYNLKTLIEANKGAPMDISTVIHWGIQLCDVLTYLHTHNPPVVFRDIKPSNIIRRPDDTIALVDFGIARQMRDGATSDTIVFGSPGYAPPEQYGHDQTEPRSDLYALGATLHHLLTGRDPSGSPFKWPAVSTLNPKVPRVLERLVMRCLEMEVTRRPDSAEAVGKSLRSIQEMVVRGGTRDLTLPGAGDSLNLGAPSSRLSSQELAVTSETGTLELRRPVIVSEEPLAIVQDNRRGFIAGLPSREGTVSLEGPRLVHPMFRILTLCSVVIVALCFAYPLYQGWFAPETPTMVMRSFTPGSSMDPAVVSMMQQDQRDYFRSMKQVESYHNLASVRYLLVGLVLAAFAAGVGYPRRPTRLGMILAIGGVLGLICLTALTLLPQHVGLFIGIALIECVALIPATVLLAIPGLPLTGRE